MSKIGKSKDTQSRFTVATGREKGEPGVTANGYFLG